MRAAILSIGDELVSGASNDTNAPWLAEQLTRRAVTVFERRTLGDDRIRIAATFCELAADVDLIVSTGGLGPTDDDLTRDALAEAVTPGEPMVLDNHAMAVLERRYAKAKRAMPESNRRQAMRPSSAECLANHHGTAPGLRAAVSHASHQCMIYVLPGPPNEMMPMFERCVLPELPTGKDADISVSRLVHAYGLSESEAAERLGELLARGRNPLVGITVSEAILTARLRGIGKPRSIEQELDGLVDDIAQRWSPYTYGQDGESLSVSVGKLLNQRHATLATAESCTGGWLGKTIVDPAGSSAYYRGGWVTYSNEMKHARLGVPQDLIESHGAVSPQVAKSMAEGALARSGADFAISITGVAGPAGGSTEKPVGTVCIGLAELGRAAAAWQFRFPGDRTMIRDRSTKSALQLLRLRLLALSECPSLLWQRPEPVDA